MSIQASNFGSQLNKCCFQSVSSGYFFRGISIDNQCSFTDDQKNAQQFWSVEEADDYLAANQLFNLNDEPIEVRVVYCPVYAWN